jgi:hypothetical protein
MPTGKAASTEMPKPENTRVRLADKCLARTPLLKRFIILRNTNKGAGKRK